MIYYMGMKKKLSASHLPAIKPVWLRYLLVNTDSGYFCVRYFYFYTGGIRTLAGNRKKHLSTKRFVLRS